MDVNLQQRCACALLLLLLLCGGVLTPLPACCVLSPPACCLLQRMNEELTYQDSHADRIRNDADTLQYKLQNVNREGFKRI